MKTHIIIIIVSLLLCSGYAQVKELSSNQYYDTGDLEFSLSMNLGRESTKEKYVSTDQNEYFPHDYTDASTYFHIGVTAGYFLLPGLSVEPELNFNFSNGSIAIIIGNISYTFFNPVKNIYPYIKIGYGITNYNPDYFYSTDMNDMDLARIINSGVGLKIKYSSSFAMKFEINYRNMQTSGKWYNSGDIEIHKNIISLTLGIAVLY
ncbi:MAG: outer membrane beta-barrel protein [Ignavibacteriaceae bacterium]